MLTREIQAGLEQWAARVDDTLRRAREAGPAEKASRIRYAAQRRREAFKYLAMACGSLRSWPGREQIGDKGVLAAHRILLAMDGPEIRKILPLVTAAADRRRARPGSWPRPPTRCVSPNSGPRCTERCRVIRSPTRRASTRCAPSWDCRPWLRRPRSRSRRRLESHGPMSRSPPNSRSWKGVCGTFPQSAHCRMPYGPSPPRRGREAVRVVERSVLCPGFLASRTAGRRCGRRPAHRRCPTGHRGRGGWLRPVHPEQAPGPQPCGGHRPGRGGQFAASMRQRQHCGHCFALRTAADLHVRGQVPHQVPAEAAGLAHIGSPGTGRSGACVCHGDRHRARSGSSSPCTG